jgi:arylsulfatase
MLGKLVATAVLAGALVGVAPMNVVAQDKKPNFVIIWGDDIGITDVSAYSKGLMGFQTPNIDSVANQGMIFTDCYGEQSCTAGRSAFITGQTVIRTGLSKVGLPHAAEGISDKDPTIAQMLKPLGYATGQFGKNHLGDRDEHLPTAHGFDEFYGNLYHLNAEEEPEDADSRPRRTSRTSARILGRAASSTASPMRTARRRSRTPGRSPASGWRRSTTTSPPVRLIFWRKEVRAGKPVFLWVNFTHMHYHTHVKPESRGQAGRWLGEYADVMIDHDKNVGTILDEIKALGIEDNTLVFYSTDNGPHINTWPDAAMTPFRNEKNSNWEGAYRVPGMVKWPGRIKPGTVSNEIISHLDWFPTILAAAGVPDVKEKLAAGYTIGDKTYKVHLDGYNFAPYFEGKEKHGPRKEFLYFSDENDLVGLRYDNWKLVFAEQREPGTMQVWIEPFTRLRAPKLFNLRMDPFERADITSNSYFEWTGAHQYVMYPVARYLANFFGTLKEFPPSQKAGTWSVEKAIESMKEQPED